MSYRRYALFPLVFAVLGTALIILPWAAGAQQEGHRGLAVAVQTETGDVLPLYAASHALVIGASGYTRGWPDLPGVRDDFERVRSALIDHGFQVETVVDPDSVELREAIRSFVLRHGHQVDHRLLIYFAGHGHTLKLAYGEEMGYILAVDTPLPDKDRSGFYAHALDMQQIEVYAKRIQAKHVLFVFDSCFSGSIFSLSRAIPENISYKTAKPVRQFITSGSADEPVPDTSIFARQFVGALAGEADINQDGYITGTELGEFLQDTVVNYSRGTQHPQYGKIRNRMLDKGDFVFVRKIVDAGAPRTSATADDRAELLFWQSVKDSRDPQMFAAYLEQFPRGLFADLARLKIEKLEPGPPARPAADPRAATTAPAVTPPVPSPAQTSDGRVRTLAIFPGMISDDAVSVSYQSGQVLHRDARQALFRRYTNHMWEATKNGLQHHPAIQLRYSYYDHPSLRRLGAFTPIAERFGPGDLGAIWPAADDKTWRPDLRQVCRRARQLGVDLVMLHKLKQEKLEGVFAVYLIDVERETIQAVQKDLNATLKMESLIAAALGR